MVLLGPWTRFMFSSLASLTSCFSAIFFTTLEIFKNQFSINYLTFNAPQLSSSVKHSYGKNDGEYIVSCFVIFFFVPNDIHFMRTRKHHVHWIYRFSLFAVLPVYSVCFLFSFFYKIPCCFPFMAFNITKLGVTSYRYNCVLAPVFFPHSHSLSFFHSIWLWWKR